MSRNDWWNNVEILEGKTRKLYRKLVEKGRKNLVDSTVTKIIEVREWEPCRHLIEDNLKKVVMEHSIFYVPKGFEPGPMIVFPITDLNDMKLKAQTKPLDPKYDNKYHWLGDKEAFLGPSWIGNSLDMLENIVSKKYVVLVEGTFDFVATRAICPDLPVLSTLTKKIGYRHEMYLRMLGADTIYLMLDQDSKGQESMEITKKVFRNFNTKIIKYPCKDQSEALENKDTGRSLQKILSNLMSVNSAEEIPKHLVLIEED